MENERDKMDSENERDKMDSENERDKMDSEKERDKMDSEKERDNMDSGKERDKMDSEKERDYMNSEKERDKMDSEKTVETSSDSAMPYPENFEAMAENIQESRVEAAQDLLHAKTNRAKTNQSEAEPEYPTLKKLIPSAIALYLAFFLVALVIILIHVVIIANLYRTAQSLQPLFLPLPMNSTPSTTLDGTAASTCSLHALSNSSWAESTPFTTPNGSFSPPLASLKSGLQSVGLLPTLLFSSLVAQ